MEKPNWKKVTMGQAESSMLVGSSQMVGIFCDLAKVLLVLIIFFG